MRDSHNSGFRPIGVIVCAFFTFAAIACAGTYSGGSGTVEDPYQIGVPADWLELIATSADWDKSFVLIQDLDMAGIPMTSVAPYNGNTAPPYFSGSIDGRGHSIQNVVIQEGLIGHASNTSIIQNLWIDNIQVTQGGGGLAARCAGILTNCHVTGTVSGARYVGGLVGWFNGNLLAPGPTQWGIMTYCSAAVMVNGTSEVGGLIGHDYGTRITSCYASGDVSGSSSVGGLMGFSQNSVISNCYAAGAIKGSDSVGGLIGYQGSTVWACYSTGKVVGTGGNIGGLAGYKYSGQCISSYWDTQASGMTTSAGGVGKSTAEMKSRSTFPAYEWDFIGAGDMWGDWIMPEDGYPKLAWEVYPLVTIPDMKGMTEAEAHAKMTELGIVPGDSYETFDAAIPIGQVTLSRPVAGTRVYSGFTKVNLFLARDRRFSGGSGTAEDPYRISNPGDWKDLMENPTDWDKHYLMTNDMDLGKMKLFPVGTETNPFMGRLDGAEYSIRNVTITPGLYEAGYSFFQYIGSSGYIQNLILEQVVIEEGNDAGGLAGNNSGQIVGCTVSGKIRGYYYLGGMVGTNLGTIFKCRSACKVERIAGEGTNLGGLAGRNQGLIHESCATGDIGAEGYKVVGGLVGKNDYQGTITECYATGNVTVFTTSAGGLVGSNSGTIQSSYSTGKVSSISSSNIGGFVGSYNALPDARISSCFWDVNTSGQSSSAGGSGVVGKTTAEMKTLATFIGAGWDFVGEWSTGIEDIWRMCGDGVSYPRLSWEFSKGGDFACPDGVGMEDLVYLAGRWMANTPATIGAADGNGDGKVDLQDFAILASEWMR
jgi:hypothetical protein